MQTSQEPMIKLQAGGVAPVISYNVPEATTHSGRNFIDLQIPDSYFIPPQAPTAKLKALTTTSLRAASAAPAEVTGAQIKAELAQQLAMIQDPLSPELQNLDLDEVVMMAQAGKQLALYRSTTGKVKYTYVDKRLEAETPPFVPDQHPPEFIDEEIEQEAIDDGVSVERADNRTPIASMLPPRERDPRDPDPEPIEPIVTTTVNITAPTNNETILGPATGAQFTISGTASARRYIAGRPSTSVQISQVLVKVGNGAYQTAALNGNSWSFAARATNPGSLPIQVQAMALGGESDVKSITVNVSLEQPDRMAPVVAIASPPNGTTVTAPTGSNSVPISISGTATDNKGVQLVELMVDNNNQYVQVNPKNAGDWSAWSKQISLSPGSHTITVRATDAAGNTAPSSINVTVNVAPPADRTGPAIVITSPAANAKINGVFSGATVTVEGSASDPSGVSSVQLFLNGNPIPSSARPKNGNDWSSWTANLLITDSGFFTITARATDSLGNTNDATVGINVTLMPDIVSRLTRLILVESYQLSSYLGNYGAGRTIKTFSLLPGEKTRISIKTYTRTEESAKSAASILDSVTDERVEEFETLMANEHSNQKNYQESKMYKVGASAKASWGWGSATISGELGGNSNSAREEFAKNVANATRKQADRASAKREMQVNTAYEVRQQAGEETAIEREVENINVSRTLNFIFRQMNQEFITLLHLVDVRVGFFRVEQINGKEENVYQEVTLPELDNLLKQVIVAEKRSEVKNAILRQLMNVFDYQDQRHSFVEEKVFLDEKGQEISNFRYLRAKKDYVSTYRDRATDTEIQVSGIILAANKYVLRTEGVMVEALLGQGNGLDDYSNGLQDQTVQAKALSNAQLQAEIDRQQLAMQIIASKDQEAAKLYDLMYRPAQPSAQPKPEQPKAQENGNGQLSHVK